MKRLLLVLLSLLPLDLYAQGAGTAPYRGVNNWNLIFGTDNVFDIGANAAQRPRTGYFGTSVITPALTVSGLTSGRVPFASTGGLLADASTLTWDGTILGATRFQAAAGSNTNPSFRMTDNDTGFAEVTAANWGWYRDGTERIRLGSGGAVTNTGGLSVGSSVAGADTALMRHAASVWQCNNNGGSVRCLLGGGAAVASASALPVPTGAWYHVTGTTTVTSQTVTNIGHGTCFTLVFDSTVTVTDGGNLKLNGNFAADADDTLGLCCDTNGNCYETHRSPN